MVYFIKKEKYVKDGGVMANALLKISDFAQLSGVNRKNLIYYDEIGLLSPEKVLANGYRFYSYHQLETVGVILTLREVGMSLSEIKRHLDGRTPQRLIDLLTAGRKNAQEKIQMLLRTQGMIDMRLDATRAALVVDPNTIELQYCEEEEQLYMGNEIQNPSTANAEDALEDFYALCERDDIIYGYPFGTLISKENLLDGKYRLPSRFFFKLPDADIPNSARGIKPAGNYLVGYEKVSYVGSAEIYVRMVDYMNGHGLGIVGSAYEEFLLDEIAVKESGEYLLRVSIQVEIL